MNNQHVFRRLLGYLKKYRLRLCMVLVFAGISTIFMVLAPFVIGEITTTLFASIQDGRILLENDRNTAIDIDRTVFYFANFFTVTRIWNG